MRLPLRCCLLALFLSLVHGAGPAAAVQVTALQARAHDGQTFLTWTCPPDTGWTYRVYAANVALLDATALTPSRMLATVGDSSWCDKRLTAMSGTPYGFVVDSLVAPLTSVQGLFVETPLVSGPRWYAVTAQRRGAAEDRTVTPGVNALPQPIAEVVQRPRPVYQRTLSVNGCSGAFYTLWTTNRATPLFPAMSNRPGRAFDSCVHLGTPDFQHALMLLQHPYGGGVYPPACVSDGDYVLKMDDLVANQEAHDFWFGYSSGYDTESLTNTPPTSGVVEDYTARRVKFTIDWARRSFPVDTTRVYAAGGSMGGIGSVFLAMWYPEIIAAAWANVPLVDFSFQSDPNPLAGFNTGNYFRLGCDRLWGTVASDLRMPDGTRVYQRMNAGALASSLEGRFIPPIIMYSGRNDQVVGWAEKIPFYRAMQKHRAGGTFYWDRKDHYTGIASAWSNQMNYGIPYLYRFRTNLSFPAFSNCAADRNPGTGAATDGDSVGTINGFLDWNPSITDQPDVWGVTLSLRNLMTAWGAMPAPESTIVDVTPRRLQRFIITPGATYPYSVRRITDGAIVQSGTAVTSVLGRLTIPRVKVHREGTVLLVGSVPIAANADASAPRSGLRPRIGAVMSPVRHSTPLEVTWARNGQAEVDLLDLAGRRIRSVWHGPVGPGVQRLQLDLAGVPSGSYAIVAREGDGRASRRIVVVR